MITPRYLPHDWFPLPLPENVQIGTRSWLDTSFCFLHYRSTRPCGVRIGRDTGIYSGSSFELGVNGEIEVGDFCTVVGATFATDNRVEIGDYTFISYEVFIADHPFPVPPDLDRIPGFASKPSTIHIGRNVWIGARATICGEVRIGDASIVGAGAVVFEDVPPQTVVAGNPARVVRHLQPGLTNQPDICF